MTDENDTEENPFTRETLIAEMAEENPDASYVELESGLDDLIEDGILVEYDDGEIWVRDPLNAAAYVVKGRVGMAARDIRDRIAGGSRRD